MINFIVLISVHDYSTNCEMSQEEHFVFDRKFRFDFVNPLRNFVMKRRITVIPICVCSRPICTQFCFWTLCASCGIVLAEPQDREETAMEKNTETLMRILTECAPDPSARRAMRQVVRLQESLTLQLTARQRMLLDREREATVALAAAEEEEMCVKAFLLGARTALRLVGAEPFSESEDDRLLNALASSTR